MFKGYLFSFFSYFLPCTLASLAFYYPSSLISSNLFLWDGYLLTMDCLVLLESLEPSGYLADDCFLGGYFTSAYAYFTDNLVIVLSFMGSGVYGCLAVGGLTVAYFASTFLGSSDGSFLKGVILCRVLLWKPVRLAVWFLKLPYGWGPDWFWTIFCGWCEISSVSL